MPREKDVSQDVLRKDGHLALQRFWHVNNGALICFPEASRKLLAGACLVLAYKRLGVKNERTRGRIWRRPPVVLTPLVTRR